MTKRRRGTFLGWLLAPLVAVLVGCGTESAALFYGAGEFSVSVVDVDGKLTIQRIATGPRFALRRGQRGGTDLVLDRSCALRSLGGSITGTYACRVASPTGPLVLELQSGTWKLTEQPTADSVGGCPLRRYSLVVDAFGSIRGQSGTASTLHFEGIDERKDCPQGGVSAGSLGSWSEDPYTGDSEWADGYDWDGDGDGDWDSGAGGDWGDDDGDSGDWDDGDGDSGDWDDDDGDWGGDDDGDWGGDGDGDQWSGDDGNWATAIPLDQSSRAERNRASSDRARSRARPDDK